MCEFSGVPKPQKYKTSRLTNSHCPKKQNDIANDDANKFKCCWFSCKTFAVVPERRVVFGQHAPVPITRRGRPQQPGHNQVTTRSQPGHIQVMSIVVDLGEAIGKRFLNLKLFQLLVTCPLIHYLHDLDVTWL